MVDARSADRTVRPARNLRGAARLPGDKSISHRYAMLAGFADGRSRIANYASGADCASTLRCMSGLGATVARDDDGTLTIDGCAGRFREPGEVLDCGNSGTTMRLLAGLLAAQRGRFTLDGDSSLRGRPMQRVAEPLREMGAAIAMDGDHAPLVIDGSELRGIRYRLRVASAQVKSAVLLAGLQSNGETVIEEPVLTRDHTELALRAFGAEIKRSGEAIAIAGGQRLRAADVTVPGDVSSAAFLLCAAAIFPGSNLVLDDVGLNPTRSAILDVLMRAGVGVQVLALAERNFELAVAIRVAGPAELSGVDVPAELVANLIDELPVLAAMAPYTKNGMRLRGAAELRVKESDRLGMLTKGLRAMGAEVTEYPDGLDVPGGQRLHGAEIESGDHRIAMALAIAALRAEGETLIRGADCVAVSFPEFFETLDRLCER
jgi:3-phosphoshikimate 1-carboxyvinyltransferase